MHKMKEQTSEKEVDLFIQMSHRADNIVTNWGRSSQISLMRQQIHRKQEPFPTQSRGMNIVSMSLLSDVFSLSGLKT